ncbi:MAG: DNA-directed RNA polymerase subunit omega [Candidatus Omnitrophica bacterium]|nr:DNA-directed RNA polymerase subunit omega [Candidatus Omnitrophota bacterium]
MSYTPLEKIIDKADNSLYKLVILASKRALELSEGMPKLIEADSEIKSTTIALKEIAQGKIRYKKD